MNKFYFTFSNQKNEIDVKNNDNVKIGTIKRIELAGCEKNHSFSFRNLNEECVKIGIKKRSVKEMFAPKYSIVTDNNHYELQDNAWKNILYFSVSGSVDGEAITIEENWKGAVETVLNDKRIGIVSFGMMSSQINIRVAKEIDTSSLLFAIIMIFPFMFKIYMDEVEFFETIIEELL